jgi:hypothetical protein
MSQHLEAPMTRRAPATPVGHGLLVADRGTIARGGTWLRDGTAIRMPLRTRLALIRPQMLKAQGGRPGRS